MKWSGIALLLLVVLVVVYFTVDILIACSKTQTIVEGAFETYGRSIAIEDLTKEQKQILLAVEDPNFYAHSGFDIKTPGAGLTTITQGMVKFLYFDEFKPGLSKIRQTLIAVFALNAKVSKDDQLTLFINSVNMGTVEGQLVHGFAEASEVYFNKNFSELSEDEYLSLVAMIVGPNAYTPLGNREKLNERVNRIKKLLNGECEAVDNRDVYYQNCP